MTPDFAQYAVLIVFVGLASIIGAVAGVSNIVKNIAVTRAARDPARTPPLPEELAKVYATKTELLAMREELRSTCKANHEHVDKIHNDIFNLIRRTQTEIVTKLDKLGTEISEWQRGIERQIGKIEGKLEGDKQ